MIYKNLPPNPIQSVQQVNDLHCQSPVTCTQDMVCPREISRVEEDSRSEEIEISHNPFLANMSSSCM